MRMLSATFIAFFMFTAKATAAPSDIKCTYYNALTDESYAGICTVISGDDSTVIRMGKLRFVIAEIRRQGQWSFLTINGKPAARYEINKASFSYATSDLTEFIDINPE